jgi:hypothetical protein
MEQIYLQKMLWLQQFNITGSVLRQKGARRPSTSHNDVD